MAINYVQLKDLIFRCLSRHGLYSQAASQLLLGTAAVESQFGTYIRQLGGGPALGIFQMEPKTYDWLCEKFKNHYPERCWYRAEVLEHDLWQAILFARLRYKVTPEPLPDAGNLNALAHFYKKHYNTSMGKATPAMFIDAFQRYVHDET